MNIKNYTSSVEACRSMAKIEELLVEIGASNINKQYADKICTGITFLLYDQQLQQTLPFHLKAQVEECFTILWQDIKRPRPDTRTAINLQATGQPYCLENPFRLDRSTMQHDFAWPGKTFANVPAIYV